MTNKNLPLISVITPVRNSAKTLEKTIQSLIDQNYPNLEYIVMDGESSDGTLDIIRRYEKHIDHWDSQKDTGPGGATKRGLKKAKGKLVAFLNADDFYEPDTLLKAGNAFASDPELEVVSFGGRILKRDGSGGYKIEEEFSHEEMSFGKNEMIKMIHPNPRVFKKELFDKYDVPMVEYYKDSIIISDDFDYMTRFAIVGVKNICIDHVAYNYLFHEDSHTFNADRVRHRRLAEERLYISKKFLQNKENLPINDFWKKCLKKWVRRSRIYITKSHLQDKNYKEAFEHFKLGLKENEKFSFIYALIKKLLKRDGNP